MTAYGDLRSQDKRLMVGMVEWNRLEAYKEGVCFISSLCLRALPFMVPLME